MPNVGMTELSRMASGTNPRPPKWVKTWSTADIFVRWRCCCSSTLNRPLTVSELATEANIRLLDASRMNFSYFFARKVLIRNRSSIITSDPARAQVSNWAHLWPLDPGCKPLLLWGTELLTLVESRNHDAYAFVFR